MQQNIEELSDKLKRQMAEFQNFLRTRKGKDTDVRLIWEQDKYYREDFAGH